MDFSVDERGDAAVITLEGNVMGGPGGQQLHDEIHALITDGTSHAVVDLSKTDFMNSSGLGMLISAMTTMRNAGGDLRLACVADRVQSLLVTTRLATVFKEYDTVEEAIDSFAVDAPTGEEA